MVKKIVFFAVMLALLLPGVLFAGAEGEKAKGPKEFSILYGGAPLPKEETFRVLIGEFEKRNPEIKVEIQTVAQQFWPQVKVRAAADDLTDVMRLDDDWSGEHMVKGVLLDLTQQIKKEVNLEDYFVQSWVPFVYGGKLYGIPYDAAVGVIYYNKNHFKEAGLAEPVRDPSKWNNEVFLNYCKKLVKDKNGDGKPDQWGYTYPSARTGYYQAQHWLWREGATIYDKDKTQVTLPNDPNAVRALQFYTDLRNKYQVMPPMEVSEQMGGSPMFYSGAVSMLQDANWSLPGAEKARQAGTIDYGITYMPSGSKGTLTRITCDAWGITKNVRDKETAWKFVKWMGSEEAQTLLAGHGTFTPPLKKVALSNAYQTNKNTYYDESIFVEIVEKYSHMGEICLQGSEISDAWTRAMEPLFFGKQTALEAAKKYKELADPILAREVKWRPFAPWYINDHKQLLAY